MTQMLDRLEAQMSTLPMGATKHDLEPGFDLMAQWISGLDPASRAMVLAELPDWFKEDHPWHSRAALEIALRLQDQSLINEAVRVARAQGITDLAEGEDYPPWLVFDLELIATLSRWQGDPGEEPRAYLAGLRQGVETAVSYSRRLLGIRAWLTQCALGAADTRRLCLGEAMETVRTWKSARIAKSALSLLHAYFASTADGVADLGAVLSLDEFAVACPSPFAHR